MTKQTWVCSRKRIFFLLPPSARGRNASHRPHARERGFCAHRPWGARARGKRTQAAGAACTPAAATLNRRRWRDEAQSFSCHAPVPSDERACRACCALCIHLSRPAFSRAAQCAPPLAPARWHAVRLKEEGERRCDGGSGGDQHLALPLANGAALSSSLPPSPPPLPRPGACHRVGHCPARSPLLCNAQPTRPPSFSPLLPSLFFLFSFFSSPLSLARAFLPRPLRHPRPAKTARYA